MAVHEQPPIDNSLAGDLPIGSNQGFQPSVKLSDSIFMFSEMKMSEHGNIFLGEIRSGVYGVRPCVIKFAEVSEQNVREARILSKLGSHTNVIAIIQSGTYSDMLEDHFYIALEKCLEENLRRYLSNRKTSGIEFDLNQANDFRRQIIDGVAYIHDNNVVHLDLKPSNILLSLDQCRIKIADFGLSREVKSSSSKFFLEGQFGTNGYRPVESFGGGWVSMRSDIFSLGAVLYHVLSYGEEVFGDDEHKYIYNVNSNIMDTSRLLVANPQTTEHLIKLMLSNERCRRPTIWQVADHPCWKGTEVECLFDYEVAEEIEDSEAKIPKETTFDSDDSESEKERSRKLAIAIRKMGISRKTCEKTRDFKTTEHLIKLMLNNERCRRPPIWQVADHPCWKETEVECCSEPSTSLMMTKEFRPAETDLKQILATEGYDKLETLLKIAECEMYLPYGNENESFQRARDFISTSEKSSVNKVLEMAINARRNDKFARSLILFHIFYDLHQKEYVCCDDTVEWIKHIHLEIACTLYFITEKFGTSGGIAVRYGLKIMEKLLKELREQKSSNPGIRAKVEVGLLASITHNLNTVGEHQKAIQFCEEGIAIAEKQFGKSTSRYNDYGILINNLGEAYEKLEQFSKAEDSYSRALKVYKKSSIPSDYIERTNARLARVLEKRLEKRN